MLFREEGNGSSKNPSAVSGSFLIQWNCPDGLVRAKLKRSDAPEPILDFGAGRIRCLEVGAHLIWAGLDSGTVAAVRYSLCPLYPMHFSSAKFIKFQVLVRL